MAFTEHNASLLRSQDIDIGAGCVERLYNISCKSFSTQSRRVYNHKNILNRLDWHSVLQAKLSVSLAFGSSSATATTMLSYYFYFPSELRLFEWGTIHFNEGCPSNHMITITTMLAYCQNSMYVDTFSVSIPAKLLSHCGHPPVARFYNTTWLVGNNDANLSAWYYPNIKQLIKYSHLYCKCHLEQLLSYHLFTTW